MDPAKVSPITSWPVPESYKQLPRFLGFAFYWCFNLVAAPLTALTSSKTACHWSDAAYRAFDILKSHFSTAPILQILDPDCQFLVDDYGKTELQIWQQGASGSKCGPGGMGPLAGRSLFLVWTDHHNLEYIRSDKRLNSRQACWSFTDLISPCPTGLVLLALQCQARCFSHQFPESPDKLFESPTIIPASRFIAFRHLVNWGKSTGGHWKPAWPYCRWAILLGWPVTLAQRTCGVLQQCFWWAFMEEDVQEYVNAWNRNKPYPMTYYTFQVRMWI